MSEFDRRSMEGIGLVTKVRHPTMHDGKVCHVNSDLIFLAGIPTVGICLGTAPPRRLSCCDGGARSSVSS